MHDIRFFAIRGFMKSGTNWLSSLLQSHAHISVTGEFHWERVLNKLFDNFKSEPLYFNDPGHKHYSRVQFDEFVKRSMAYCAEPDSYVVGDRTPHTLDPVILRDSPHISIIRDGRDVLVSRAFHLYNQPDVHRLFDRIPEMGKTLKQFQDDPQFFQKNPDQLLCHEVMVRESMKWWTDHLESDRATLERYPDLKVKFIKYEDLHRDTEGVRADCFKFLEVDPSRAGAIEGVLKPGFDGEERPTEFLRKGVVGDWKNYFTDDAKVWFKDVAGDELVTQGYTKDLNW